MQLTRIEQLLQDTMGLNAASIGSSAIQRAVRERMRRTHIDDSERYQQRLESSPEEMRELIELVVIPETWFFRNWHPFQALKRHLEQHWLPRAGERRLRLLSLPCSTGEEPYTLAMVLANLGLAPDQTEVHGVDISRYNIDTARLGIYRQNSFRGDHLDYRDTWFRQTDDRYHLHPDIRDRVRFEQGNLLDPEFSRDRAPYDVIFCRNLLIYFDRPTQAQAIDILEGLLGRDGLLFVGHAETGVLAGRGFRSLNLPQSFGFHRELGTAGAAVPAAPRLRQSRRSRRTPIRPRRQPRPHWIDQQEQAVAAPPQSAADPGVEQLEQATRLADDGHLVEAAELCEQLLEAQGAQAQALYLLGLIRDAAGEPEEAERLLRQAIYLDPAHCPAMLHLALVLQRRGEARAAQRMQERLERCQQREAANTR
ncbi:putative biofilm formation methyltransferase WspC [Thiohalobacter sp. COW1]|uniref:CheR family methyltransferase n=1 Tax=Thiohalobacter sp. COW1 TaxID=2795687 RepID=UPI0019156886|nr:protein-glutamate O-methyltransferase CheR [Thiohalobacter sp. COW1]BCO29917.1 putative biofilm formation methyltransferase WspC [Thiohalobacter sp. COW1]